MASAWSASLYMMGPGGVPQRGPGADPLVRDQQVRCNPPPEAESLLDL